MVEFIISSLSGCSTRTWTQQDRLPCGFCLIIIRPKLTQIFTNIIRVLLDAVRPEIHQCFYAAILPSFVPLLLVLAFGMSARGKKNNLAIPNPDKNT